ncbi:MAG: EamA family transporter [Bdellovibrionota bacterium]
MPWQLLALLTAAFDAGRILILKKTVKSRSPLAITFYLNVVVFICSLPIILNNPPVTISSSYIKYALLVGSLGSIAILFYNRALKASDISITVPMMSFVPFFLIFTSPFFVNETPSVNGVLGILLIVVGAYILQISKKSEGFFAPFKHLLSEKGPQYMLLVAFIYSITSNFEKLGVLETYPVFWVGTVALIRSVILGTCYISERVKDQITLDRNLFIGSVAAGIFHFFTLTFQMSAFETGPVSYVIAIKRFSMVLTAIYACWILKEGDFKERISGTLIMFIGLVVVSLLA